jgi:hypothetical protein
MKNFILTALVIIVASAVLQPFLPWYVIGGVAFGAGYLIKQSWFAAFTAGFVAIFLLWVAYAFVLSHANNDLLARKVAAVLPLRGNVHLLLLITGIIGGLVSGLAAMTGRFAGDLK